MKILDLFELPEARKIKIRDFSNTTLVHKDIIQKKPFLRKVYLDFYKEFKCAIHGELENMFLVEIGSGPGMIKEVIPNIITSDVTALPFLDICLCALNIPFKDCSIDAFFMLDVLHHLAEPTQFFREVNRCLKVGGKLVMIEPANTPFYKFIYKKLHHEIFDEHAKEWRCDAKGRLTTSNSAMAWIIFCRDISKFKNEFHNLRVNSIRLHTPFRYLLSGGLTFYAFLPTFTYNIIVHIETALAPLNKFIAMYKTIEIEKTG